MRIVIDLQALQNGNKYRGIGRYVLSFTKALIKNRGNNEIILLISSLFPTGIENIKQEFDEYRNQCEIKVWYGIPNGVSYLTKDNNWRRKASEYIREAYIDSLNPDILLIGSIFDGAGDDFVVSVHKYSDVFTAVILYDFIPHIYKNEYLGDPMVSKWYYEKLEYIKRADLCLAISESSGIEGVEIAKINPNNILNISAATEDIFRKIDVNELEKNKLFSKHKITKPYLMYSGATDPRKNIDRLIEAFSMLPVNIKNNHQLVLVGGMPECDAMRFKNLAKQYGLDPSTVIFTLRVSDRELVQLYNLCKGFILPSYHEGFGLPLLEAMACGAPAIGANLSSIPEVINNDEALFDPFDVNAIMQKIQKLLTNEKFRKGLVNKGTEQVKRFSWDKSALKTLQRFQVVNFNKCRKSKNSLIDVISKISDNASENDLMLSAVALSSIQGLTNNNIYVDISELYRHDGNSGIQRVVRCIMNNLLTMTLKNYDIKFVYATETESYKVINKIEIENGKLKYNIDDNFYLSYDCRDGDIFFGLDFHDRIVFFQRDLYKLMHTMGIKIFFLVYDLLPINQSKYFDSKISDNYMLWLKTITSVSDGIVCISHTVRNELVEWIKINKIKYETSHITASYLGADIYNNVPSFGMPKDAIGVLDYFKNSKTFVIVSTIEPRKGQAQTLNAFEILWQSGIDINLVLVGKQGWMVDELIFKIQRHKNLNKKLFWLNNISDEYLEKIYEASTCLILASEGEGFGLPLIEAAQKKLPIIARDISVFREVAGIYAYYFHDDNDPIVLAKAIEEWLTLYQNRKYPKSDDMPWLTWKESTQALLLKIIGNDYA